MTRFYPGDSVRVTGERMNFADASFVYLILASVPGREGRQSYRVESNHRRIYRSMFLTQGFDGQWRVYSIGAGKQRNVLRYAEVELVSTTPQSRRARAATIERDNDFPNCPDCGEPWDGRRREGSRCFACNYREEG